MKRNNLKENPIMNNKKVKKLKRTGMNISSEDENDIKTFIIILVVIVVLVLGIYFLTTIIHKNKNNDTDSDVVAGEINYDKVNVGTILNRPYDDYYVLIYNSEDNEAVRYSTLLNNYMENNSKDGYIKIYFCDLGNSLNSSYYNVNEDNKSNQKAKEVKDFDFSDITLLKIKKGKISEYIEDYKTIQEKLK